MRLPLTLPRRHKPDEPGRSGGMMLAMDEPYDIPAEDQALLDECQVDTFRSTGRGGQSVNTTDSAVRLRHLPTNTTVVSRRQRSQYQNKRAALVQLRERLEERNASIAAGSVVRKARRPSRAVKQNVVAQKRARGSLKRTRGRVGPDAE